MHARVEVDRERGRGSVCAVELVLLGYSHVELVVEGISVIKQ